MDGPLFDLLDSINSEVFNAKILCTSEKQMEILDRITENAEHIRKKLNELAQKGTTLRR